MSEWELTCWEGQAEYDSDPKDTAHILPLLIHGVVIHGVYIKDVAIPETNKRLNSAMNLSEYFRVIGCRLIMAYYVGHSVRDFFLKYLITP